jgi:putative SOS response-associated peptidase YedK
MFSFAGIWDEWKNPEGVPLRTFSIITTEANESMEPVHDRMPVILPREAEASWLDPSLKDAGKLMPFLRPCPSNLIAMHEVSPEVNSVKTDSAKLIEPAEPSGGQLTLKLF